MSDVLYTANPSDNGIDWYVWNSYEHPPQPVYFGPMEECQSVSDAMNANLEREARGL